MLCNQSLVYLQFSKAGSTSVRERFDRCGHHMSAIVKGQRRQEIVREPCGMFQSRHGACQRLQASYPESHGCRYFTVLREPLARVRSSWAYFCLQCAEGKRFCGYSETVANGSRVRVSHHEHDGRHGCPNMNITEWARLWGNSYVNDLSGANLLAAGGPGEQASWLDEYASWAHDLREAYPGRQVETGGEAAQRDRLRVASRRILEGEVLALPLDALSSGEAWKVLKAALGQVGSCELEKGSKHSNAHSGTHLNPRTQLHLDAKLTRAFDDARSELNEALRGDLELWKVALEKYKELASRLRLNGTLTGGPGSSTHTSTLP